MKYIIVIFFLLLACKEDGPDPQPQTDKGCMTGISKSSGKLELIRCCTNAEFLAGSNVGAGGTSQYEAYTNHKWERCSQCQ